MGKAHQLVSLAILGREELKDDDLHKSYPYKVILHNDQAEMCLDLEGGLEVQSLKSYLVEITLSYY